jgi:PQQ-dependent dehydrogenase (methanol/ethanol family)
MARALATAALACVLLWLGASVAQAQAARVDHARLLAADAEPGQWLSHGRTYAEQRFSPLDRIRSDNVERLGLAWHFDLPTRRGLEATPLAIDGVLYVSGAWSRVYAIDGRSGRLLWRYDPAVPRAVARQACCDVVNRGVAAWNGLVYVGTLDGRLVALDARDGSVRWEVMTVDPAKPYTITGAPRVVKGQVVIGNGGAEYGVRGYVTAYDALTGRQSWRFHTVPGNPADGFESKAMRRAAETWNGEWWKLGGGGTVWDSMAYDPELDLLYIGVGNGSPWNRRLRSPGGGDNLFLSSIVALRPETGEYVWHYQVVPGATWDSTATQHMILADIEWQGAKRLVLMQAPKSGFFMIIDRETGEFLSAEPYAKVSWATHYDPATGRPVEVEGQDYAEGSATVKPTSGGAHNWQPMAFHPGTGLVYFPVMEAVFEFEDVDAIRFEPGLRNRGIVDAANPPGDALFLEVLQERLAVGHLLAWDPRKQRAAWRFDLGAAWNGGVLATGGGLVFHGSGDRHFRAHRAETGEALWSFETQTGVIATPISYEIDGEQYVSILAGWGGAFGLMSGVPQPPAAPNGRLLTFKLDANEALPAIPASAPVPDPPPRMDVPDEVVERGAALYGKYCGFCHGTGMVSGGTVPDLRRLAPEFHTNFDAIVRLGAVEALGMPSFGDVLDAADVEALHAFVIEKAHEDKAAREAPAWWTAIKRFVYRILTWVLMLFVEPSIHTA